MVRLPGTSGDNLDGLIARFEDLVMRILQRIADAAARLLGGTPDPVHAQAVSLDDLGVIRGQWAQALDADVLPALVAVYDQAAATLAADLSAAGRDVAALAAPDAAAFLGAARNRLVGVGDRLWEAARDELGAGLRAGEDAGQLAVRVRGAAGVAEPRARVIARTEVLAANHAASIAQVRTLGDPTVIKEWLATPGLVGGCDARTRPTHCAADGQRVRINERFKVGEAHLDYPCDPLGLPDEVIGCRCSPAFDLDDEPASVVAAAADPAPTRTDGVTLAASGVDVDQWDDGTYTIGWDDAGQHEARLTDDEADQTVDALNKVRGVAEGEQATASVDTAHGETVTLSRGKGDDVILGVGGDAGAAVTLPDGDAYDLSYQLALWLDRGGYYDRHPTAAAAMVAARKPWNPDQHPRDPLTGRFIGKGLVPRKSGGEAKSGAIPKPPDAKGPGGGGAPGTASPQAAERVNRVVDSFRPKRISNDRDAMTYLKSIKPKLTPTQAGAIDRYTGDTFFELNKRLRSGDSSDPDIARLDASMRPLPDDLMVTRNVGPEAFGVKDLAELVTLRGRTFSDETYSSTALGTPYGMGLGGVTMRIAVPKGTRSVPASEFSRNPTEREILLDRGLEMVITRVEPNDRFGYDVYAVVVPKEDS